jgi:hypothetical protein
MEQGNLITRDLVVRDGAGSELELGTQMGSLIEVSDFGSNRVVIPQWSIPSLYINTSTSKTVYRHRTRAIGSFSAVRWDGFDLDSPRKPSGALETLGLPTLSSSRKWASVFFFANFFTGYLIKVL